MNAVTQQLDKTIKKIIDCINLPPSQSYNHDNLYFYEIKKMLYYIITAFEKNWRTICVFCFFKD